MGGCCCFFSRGPELSSPREYNFCPRSSEERLPLSAHHSAVSVGLLVDTNLETSIIDTYTPPPPPLPYNTDVRHSQSPPITHEICGNKHGVAGQTVNYGSVGDTIEHTDKREGFKEADCLDAAILDPEKKPEVDLSKPSEPYLTTEEEDACPICLEEYEEENPKIITKCEHHYHLACILEWMERSDTCPVCDKEAIF